jgi:hypothetical protein
MVLATLGFFAFTAYSVLVVDADRVRILGLFGYRFFHALYALILFPSALWLPLTAAMVGQPSRLLWLGILLVLALVALGSVGLLLALLAVRQTPSPKGYWLAVIGSLTFCFQTVVLDLFVWTAFFPRSFG